jgi:hypothetical protein
MEADRLTSKLQEIIDISTRVANSGTIAPLKMSVEEKDGVCFMVLMVADIPFVDQSFSDVTIFNHQAIASCIYVQKPVKYFHIVGKEAAVQQCVREYLLEIICKKSKTMLRTYWETHRKSPAPYPLWCCDVRNVLL